MEKINVIYVRFDKNLDYKQVVNSYPIHQILESAFGDTPHMVSPTKYTFDRDKLGVFIQDQWESSKTYTLAKDVGKRHGNPTVLEIDAKQMREDGIKFYLSNNNVWLTKYVDPKYIKEI